MKLVGLCNAPGGSAWMQIVDEETRVRVVQIGIMEDGSSRGLVQVNRVVKDPTNPEVENVIQRIGGWLPIKKNGGLPDWDVPLRWTL